MAKKFLTGLNLVVLDTDPTAGSEGELYFNSSASVAKIYQAGAWSVLGAGGGGGSTTVSTTEPESPEIGDSWYKNDTGEFYVYDGTYWVEVNGVVSLSQEQVQDYVAPLFTHENHVNASVTYDDELNQLHIDVVSAPTAGFTSTLKHDVRLNGSIAKGQAVYVSSANGTNMVVSKASNASEATSSKTLGLLETGGSNNALVKVVTEGLLAGLNTSTANSEGDPVWLGTDGNLIYGLANKPYAPAHLVFIGIVTRKNSSNGEIFVKVQNGFELNEIHDIGIGYGNSIGDEQTLVYSSSASLWQNKLQEEVFLRVYNNSGSVIPALSPVYYVEDTVNGINVGIADSNSALDPNKLPAIGITKSSIANGSSGNIVIYGKISGIDTNAFDSNDSLFVASGGGLTSSRPTGTANVQEVGKVIVGQSASAGQILVYNTGRKNDIPNLAEGKVWLGNLTAYPVATTLNTSIVPEGGSGPYYFTNEKAVDALSTTLENYLTTSSASSTYLTQVNASTTYQPVGSYLTTETDPVFSASDAAGIDSTDISNWNTAYGWGNHASAGYLTTETDPVFSASDAAGIDSTDISNWNTSYGWGNHASAGYALSSHNHTLDSLSNVVITGTPSDGQAIVWDTSTSKWVNETVSGGASYPDQTGNDGKFLQTNSGSVSWQNVSFAGYLTESSASSTYLTKASASSTYQPIGSYLTTESDTLETVTDRGATTSNAISITNTTVSTSPTTGALVVSGGVGIDGDLHVSNDIHIDGDINVTGSISGSLTYINVTDLIVTDPLIYLAENNQNDMVDIGTFGAYNHSASIKYHTGLIRDASDSGKWKLASNLLNPTSNVIDFTGANFDTLKIGALEVTDASTTRTNLGLTIGTNVQEYSATLAGINTLGSGTGFLKNTAGTWSYDNSTYLTTSSASTTYAPLANPTFTGTVGGITKSMVGLGSVENTALSTWTGSSSITTLGTISSGTWSGTTIGYTKGGTGLTTLGTAGQVLKVNAGATAIEWGDASGGSSFTNSSELRALLSDETGSGSAVFSASPTFTGTVTIPTLNINSQAIIEGSTGTTSATSSFNTTVYSSAEFIVYGSTASGNYVSKVLMLARGTATPVITEYAILTQGTAPTVTITPSYSAPNAVLTVGVTSGTNIEIIAIEVSI